IEIQISLSADLAKFVLMKGSIAIDGVSLTVFGIENNILTISIIPHTAKETVLGSLDVGDIVNVEAEDRKSTRLNSSHVSTSYAVFCLKKKNKKKTPWNIKINN